MATQTEWRDHIRKTIAAKVPIYPPYGQLTKRQWLMNEKPKDFNSDIQITIWREEVDRLCGGTENNKLGLF